MKHMFTRMLVVLLALTTVVTPCLSSAASLPLNNEPNPTAVKSALSEFNSLSKKEKKARFKEVKKAVKDFKAKKAAGQAPTTNTLLLVIVAILLPPLAVLLHQGELNSKFWIALLLTLLFYIPGLIYALVVILGDKG